MKGPACPVLCGFDLSELSCGVMGAIGLGRAVLLPAYEKVAWWKWVVEFYDA